MTLEIFEALGDLLGWDPVIIAATAGFILLVITIVGMYLVDADVKFVSFIVFGILILNVFAFDWNIAVLLLGAVLLVIVWFTPDTKMVVVNRG